MKPYRSLVTTPNGCILAFHWDGDVSVANNIMARKHTDWDRTKLDATGCRLTPYQWAVAEGFAMVDWQCPDEVEELISSLGD